jgi:guanine deaminase
MFRYALLSLTASAIAVVSASAETSVAEFYRNKSIDVYIGLSAGGLYDINARLLSRFMGRHIPGNPTLVPRNMIGAAGFRLANFSRAEIDLLAEHDAGVVLNPQGNLKMKCGIAPIRALQDADVRIGLGCDNCSCSDAQNMFMAMKLFALLAAISDPVPGPPQAVAALRAATEGGAQGARLGDVLGRIAPGFKADLTLIDTRDPTLNSVARQLVHIEAGRGVRHVIVDGKVVVRNRELTTVDESTIYDAVKAVTPEFRRDFATISQRVAKLQPWLDRAHRRIMAAELDIDRLPFGGA